MPTVTVRPTHVVGGQKAKYPEYAGDVLGILAKQEPTEFHFLSTGDESWLFDSYDERTV
jgi:hypothetical protein